MSRTNFSGNQSSSYGSDLIIKEVHDYYGQALRTIDTRSVVNSFYTHFRVEYNSSSKPVVVNYYRGTNPHKTTFNATSASPLLDGAYFKIYSGPDNRLWVIWFNIDGTSIQPIVPEAEYIEISVNSGDSAEVVALAITLILNNLHKDIFSVTRNGINLEIKTVELAEVTNSDEGTTPFVFSQISGTQELVQKVEIKYQGNDPIYKGQLLKNYQFNIFKGTFEINDVGSDGEDWDEILTTFPTPESELFTYRLGGTTVQTILVTYLDSTKLTTISVQKTRI